MSLAHEGRLWHHVAYVVHYTDHKPVVRWCCEEKVTFINQYTATATRDLEWIWFIAL